MKIRYSPESIDDLHGVVKYVEEKNPFAARRIVLDLQEGVEKLKQFTKIGLPVLKAPDPDHIRDLCISNHTVRYLIIAKETLYVLRIWHDKENERNL